MWAPSHVIITGDKKADILATTFQSPIKMNRITTIEITNNFINKIIETKSNARKVLKTISYKLSLT